MKTVAELTELMRDAGMRVTPQRQAVMRHLQGVEHHPTVDALHAQVVAEMPTVSLRTTYQTVHELADLGEVHLIDVGTGATRIDPNVEADHHHLVCTTCGRVRDLPLDFEEPRLPARYRRSFHLERVDVIFRGTCDECEHE